MLTWLGYIDGKCYHIWHTWIRHGIWSSFFLSFLPTGANFSKIVLAASHGISKLRDLQRQWNVFSWFHHLNNLMCMQMKPAANFWSIPASFQKKTCNYGLKPKIPRLEDKPAPSGGCSAHIRISVSSRKHTGHDWSETGWSISRSKINKNGNLMVIIMGMYGNTMGYI